jgi:hypothetical protein
LIHEVLHYNQTFTMDELRGNGYVIDDFLHMDDALILEQQLGHWDRKWQVITSNVSGEYSHAEPDVRDIYMKYDFFDKQYEVSDDIWLMDPFIKNKLNPIAITRIRANLYPAHEEPFEVGYHTDYPGLATAVYYVNSNNGGTKFADGSFVQSKRGRCVIFDSELPHTTVTQTDTPARILINFNYLPGKNPLAVKDGPYE